VNYIKAARMQRTVHLHVLGKDDLVNDNDITLVTQMTSERYDKLYNLATRWSGEYAQLRPIHCSIGHLHGRPSSCFPKTDDNRCQRMIFKGSDNTVDS